MRLGFGLVAGALSLMLMSVQRAGCTEYSIGGRTADKVFPDPKLADLARASCNGDRGAIERDLQAGADANGRGVEGFTVLAWAVSCDRLEAVAALLAAGADPNGSIGGQYGPVALTVSKGNPAILKLLLKHGADPNSRDLGNDSMLYLALERGMHGWGWDNWYTLLDGGADINRADSAGNTIAISAAAFREYGKVVELLERGYDYDLPALAVALDGPFNATEFPKEAAAREKAKVMLASKGIFAAKP